jgi:DivIVA domain-containing protein
MSGTSLLAPGRLTQQDVQDASFPRVFRGYDVLSVERFLDRCAAQIGSLGQALEDARGANSELVAAANANGSGPHPAQPGELQALGILRSAQQQADSTIDGARREAQRLVETARGDAQQLSLHTRQQADGMLTAAKRQADEIVAAARAHAEAERARIIDAATADSRQQVDHLTRLAAEIRDKLRGTSDDLFKQVSEWDGQVHDGAPAAEPGAG